MQGDTNSKIEQIINEGYPFKFGDYISQGFNILQKNMGGFFLFSLVSVLLMFVIALIPILGIIAIIIVIGPTLIAGIYLVADKVHRGETAEFSDFFKGFDYVGPIVLVTIVSFLINQVLTIPYYMANADTYYYFIEVFQALMDDPANIADLGEPPTSPFWTNILRIPSIYISVAYFWGIHFVVFYKMGFWDALEASRRVITKNWFIIFAFVIVITLIAVAGVIGLCVGIFITFPAMMCMSYAAFADVTQLHNEWEENDDIEQHLIT